MKKVIFGFFALLFIATPALVLRPVPSAHEGNVDIVSGIIHKVYEPCCYDVSFRLEGDKRNYYVNRGLERGLNIDELHTKLQGKEVEMKIIRHWTPLDWNKSLGSIAEVKLGDEIIFTTLN